MKNLFITGFVGLSLLACNSEPVDEASNVSGVSVRDTEFTAFYRAIDVSGSVPVQYETMSDYETTALVGSSRSIFDLPAKVQVADFKESQFCIYRIDVKNETVDGLRKQYNNDEALVEHMVITRGESNIRPISLKVSYAQLEGYTQDAPEVLKPLISNDLSQEISADTWAKVERKIFNENKGSACPAGEIVISMLLTYEAMVEQEIKRSDNTNVQTLGSDSIVVFTKEATMPVGVKNLESMLTVMRADTLNNLATPRTDTSTSSSSSSSPSSDFDYKKVQADAVTQGGDCSQTGVTRDKNGLLCPQSSLWQRFNAQKKAALENPDVGLIPFNFKK